MTLLLKIAIGVFGLLGSILAIGGDTWLKEPKAWHQRITRRGWAALAALVLAFLSGTAHELLTHSSSLKAAQVAAQRHEQLTALLVDLSRSSAINSSDPSRSTREFANEVERSGFPELAKELFQPDSRIVTALNVREGPSAESPVVARISPGEPFRRLVSVPRWLKVETMQGTVGYVAKVWAEPVMQ